MLLLELNPKLCVKLEKKNHAWPYKPALKWLVKAAVIEQLVSRLSSELKTSHGPLEIPRDFRVGAAGMNATFIIVFMANQ